MAKDKLGRRSRFKRTRTGKIIQLTARDIEILRWLYRYRFLRAPHLVALIEPKSEKRFIERLGDLFHEAGLIDRPEAQWRSFDARYQPIIYELSPKGQKHLDELGALPHRATSLARRGKPGSTPQFDHAMMIVDATVDVELETIAAQDQRFVPVDEILARAPDLARDATKPLAIPVTVRPRPGLPDFKAPVSTNIVPDGLYGIEYFIDGEKRYRFWALECENRSPAWRSKTGLSSTAMKRAAYEALIKAGQHRKVWGVPNLRLRLCP